MKHSIIKIFVLALMVLFTNVSLASAANVVTKADDGHVSIKADAEHLQILNQLKGTKISYGELIAKVYPEALKDIPKETLKNMYNTPFNWDEQSTVKGGGTVVGLSSLGNSFNPLEYGSSTNCIPYGAYTFDYVSVLSLLEYHPIGDSTISIIDSEYDYDENTLRVSVDGEWDGFSYGGYRTHGTHYAEDEGIPGTDQTMTDWLYLIGK